MESISCSIFIITHTSHLFLYTVYTQRLTLTQDKAGLYINKETVSQTLGGQGACDRVSEACWLWENNNKMEQLPSVTKRLWQVIRLLNHAPVPDSKSSQCQPWSIDLPLLPEAEYCRVCFTSCFCLELLKLQVEQRHWIIKKLYLTLLYSKQSAQWRCLNYNRITCYNASVFQATFPLAWKAVCRFFRWSCLYGRYSVGV